MNLGLSSNKKLVFYSICICIFITSCIACIYQVSLASSAFSFDLHSIKPADQSLSIIGKLLGGKLGPFYLGGAINPVFQKLISNLNGFIIIIGVVLVSYIIGVSTLNTAQDGSILGKKYSSLWIPLRCFLGFAVMAPLPGSGYSVLQILMMQIIIASISMANHIWDIVLTSMSNGISPVSSRFIDENDLRNMNETATNFTKNLAKFDLCVRAVNQIAAQRGLRAQLSKPYTIGNLFEYAKTSNFNQTADFYLQPAKINFSGHDANFNFSYKLGWFDLVGNNKSAVLTKLCGHIIIDNKVDSTDFALISDASERQQQAKHTAAMLAQSKQQALQLMRTYLKPINEKILQTKPSVAAIWSEPVLHYNLGPDYIQKAIDIYYNQQVQFVKPANLDVNSAIYKNLQSSKQNGWLSSGFFYFSMSSKLVPSDQKLWPASIQEPKYLLYNGSSFKPDTEFSGALLPIPLKHVPASASNLLSLDEENWLKAKFNLLDKYLKVELEHNHQDYLKRQLQMDLSQSVSSKNKISKLANLTYQGNSLTGFGRKALSRLQQDLSAEQDPMINLILLGNNIMSSAEHSALIALAMYFGTSVAGVDPSDFLKGIDEKSLTTVFGLLSPLLIFGMMALVLLWSTGAFLAVYLPLVPTTIFVLTVVGWLMLVLESIIAIPIVGIAMMSMTGDELGKLQPSLQLGAQILFKPSLIILGFFLSIKLFETIIGFINFGIVALFDTVPNNGSILIYIPILMTYVTLCTAVAQKCFSLIHVISDRAFVWAGFQSLQTDTGAIQEVQRSADGTIQKTSGALEKIGGEAVGKLKSKFKI